MNDGAGKAAGMMGDYRRNELYEGSRSRTGRAYITIYGAGGEAHRLLRKVGSMVPHLSHSRSS